MLAQRIGNGEAVLTTLSGVYQAAEFMSSTELTSLSEQILERYSFISAIAQSQALLAEDLPQFESTMRLHGFPQFQVHPYEPEDSAPALPETGKYHLPVAFLEPLLPSNARNLGVDANTHPGLSVAVTEAIRTGGVTALPLDWLTPGDSGYALVRATYFGHFAPETEEDRQDQLSGVFFLLLNLERMLSDVGHPGISIELRQPEHLGGQPLAARLTAPASPDAFGALPPLLEQRPLTLEHGELTAVTGREVYLTELNLGLALTAMLVAAITIGSFVYTVRNRRQSRLAQGAAELAVVRERDRAEVTLQSIGDAVVTTDNECRIQYLNPVAQRLTGWSSSDATGRKVDEVVRLIHEETGETVTSASKIYDRPAEHGNYLLVSRQGRTIAVDHCASPLRDGEGGVIGGVLAIRDVSRIRELTQKLIHQANHDSLTGLPNRSYFQAELARALARCRRRGQELAILFFDLDQFKMVNDTLGHAAGDQLLRRLTRALKGVLREEDMVSRLGGDEFAAILENVQGTADVSALAQRALDAIDRAFDLDGVEVFVTTSIGIAMAPRDGTDLPTLLKHADIACYHAKSQGRNNYQFYTEDMNADAVERMELEKHLRRALERGEFRLHYQPQLDLASGRIVGAEALIRWYCPELGVVPPARFIPVAEDAGLIVEIGEWVLQEACRQNQEWRRRGFSPITVSVNLSPRQFRERDLVDMVQRVLERSDLAADGLCLEITESAIMEDIDAACLTLKALGDMGISVAIDDFGTGYSSLSVLKQFPLDALKIDYSFIRDIVSDDDDLEIVSAVIAMAHNLRLEVVAEGVEDEAQLNLLAERGCDTIQGHYLSEACAPDSFSVLLEQTRYSSRLVANGRFADLGAPLS